MKIAYRHGDMFASNEPVLIHGCNMHGVMGSGVAATIRSKHPDAYLAYRAAFESQNGLHMGDAIWAESNGILIGNLITQMDFGRDPNVVYANYNAIQTAMRAVNEKVRDQYATVGMPTIGAGLANGNWSIISAIIEQEAKDFAPVVYIREKMLYDMVANQ